MPLTSTPYADIARQLGVYETTVLETLKRLQTEGVVSRIGAVFRPNRLGASTLAAIAVPTEELEDVAAMVSEFVEVNHNYEREHRFNLWFVVVAEDEDRLEAVLAEIEERCGYPVLDLPLLNEYFIDLGFDLKWT
jgi:DNA-binding Lrp family transcriptional regulator